MHDVKKKNHHLESKQIKVHISFQTVVSEISIFIRFVKDDSKLLGIFTASKV